MNWGELIEKILTSDAVVGLVVAAVAAAFAWVRGRERIKAWKLDIAAQAVEVGVQKVYEEYVRATKDAAADGKLTDAERAKARAWALTVAGEYAKTRGVDLLEFYGKEYLPVLVEKILRRVKGEAAEAIPLTALPELDADETRTV